MTLNVVLAGCVSVRGVSLVYLPCAGLTWNITVAATISILLEFVNVEFLLINAFECAFFVNRILNSLFVTYIILTYSLGNMATNP